MTMDEYHDDHDEFVIEIAASDDGQDVPCKLITTDARIGQRWFRRMRLSSRRRAVEVVLAAARSLSTGLMMGAAGLLRDRRSHVRAGRAGTAVPVPGQVDT